MTATPRHRACFLLTAALIVATTMGCSMTADPSTPGRTAAPDAERGDPGPVRTDLEPLTRRFAALGTPRSATWQSGVLGKNSRGSVPGPSSYRIDAVVTLAPDTTQRLAALAAPPSVAPPVLPPALAPSAPAGPWLRSPELDRAFVGAEWSADAYLAPSADVVVLLATDFD